MKTRACRPSFDSRKLDAENGYDGNCKLLGMAEHRNARVRAVVRPLAKQGGFEGGVNKNGSLKSLETRVGEVNEENSLGLWRIGLQREFSDTDVRQKSPLSHKATDRVASDKAGTAPKTSASIATWVVALVFWFCGGWVLLLLAWMVFALRYRDSRRFQRSYLITPVQKKAPLPRPCPSVSCAICQDTIVQGAPLHAPCGHAFHTACMTHLFEAATRDESLFPPRCCGNAIPLRSVRKHIPPTLIALFLSKAHEFGTINRVYCSNRKCNRFLGRKDERRAVPLPPRAFRCSGRGCRTRTCGRCKRMLDGPVHECDAAEEDEAEVLELSHSSGWTRCPGCEQMIELHTGCYHMTCRCRTQFCYLCRARWKTCPCALWNKDSTRLR